MYRRIRPLATANRTAVWVLPVVGGQPITSLGRDSLDQAVARALQPTSGFTGDLGACRLIEADKGTDRAILVGLGATAEQVNLASWRRAAAAVLKCAWTYRLTALRWPPAPGAAASDAANPIDIAAAIGSAVNLANFEFTEFRAAPVGRDKPLDLSLTIDGGKKSRRRPGRRPARGPVR